MASQRTVKTVESVSVRDFFETYGNQLETQLVAGDKGLKRLIREKSINRPALALTGYLDHLAFKRIQLFGLGELGYLKQMPHKRQVEVLNAIAEKGVPCFVIGRGLVPTPAMLEVADNYNIALYRSTLSSKDFTTTATILIETVFAQSTTEHGVMVDVKGVGVLIKGKSGMGKSECALGLIERGHSLVADDQVYLRLLNEKEVMATSNELTRGYLECRGLGFIDVIQLFGIRAHRKEKRVDLVVEFVEWSREFEADRTGLDEKRYEILGFEIPHMTIPVRPGRDLAQLVETAAMLSALKATGHDPAKELNERILRSMAPPEPAPEREKNKGE